MKIILPLCLTVVSLLWLSTVNAQNQQNKPEVQKVSAENPYATGVVTEYVLDDKGNTLIRKRGTLKSASAVRKTKHSNAERTSPPAVSATFQKAEKIEKSVATPVVAEIRRIEQHIISLQNSDKADKAQRLDKLEKLLEKKKIEQAILHNRQ